MTGMRKIEPQLAITGVGRFVPDQAVSNDGSHFDRHENVRQLDAQLGYRASRWIRRKELGVLFIKAREVVRPGQQHVNFDHVLKLSSGGPQDVLAIYEGLPRLVLDRRAW